MRMMRGLLAILGLFGVLGFALTFEIEASFTARAKLIEVVERHPDLLRKGGQGYTTLIAPDLMVWDDSRGVLPGFGERGALLVDATYLRSTHAYPVSIKSIQTMAWTARVGTTLTALACLIGYFGLPKLRSSESI